MKCHLSSESCSEYKLNVTHYAAGESNEYSCVFKAYERATDCECKVEVPGFVMGENFNTALLKGGNVLFVKVLETGKFLKPKTPVLKVQKTENGNFKVTWDAKYKRPKNFVDGLKIKLYGIIGKGQKEPLEGLNTVGFIEIISSNLDPKTNYSLTATMSTHYNNYMIESDESKPLAFTTPSSPNDILKIIPVVCVALITLIFIIFIMTFSIKRVWWDKISKPKINSDFDPGRNINTMSPSIVPISPIRADILKSDLNKEKKWTLSPVDTKSEKSSTSVDSAAGDYGETGTDTREEDNICTRTERELKDVFESIWSAKLIPMSSTYSKVPVVTENHLGSSSQRERNCYNRDSGNCSGSSCFSNLAYAKSPAYSYEQLPCDTVYVNEPTINSDNHPVGSDIGKTQSDDNTDEMLTRNKFIVSKNPLYPTLHDSNMIVCDNEYQDKGIKQQWNSTTSTVLGNCGAKKVCQTGGHAPSFQPYCFTLPLHIKPNIEMVDSYHAV
ncbi:IL-4RA-like protein 1 membrane anchored form [Triplophysa rosa]|uniref:IL-4RA-like protein 1 membrane anchored form n=2 Tax=Triplophysa rosa TaxID=992332 RepID=A0A9W7WMC1_TRIRA|nr:IL-4RA-like protein 1 membrane anchored form [Triplophysa rosa]